MERNWLVRDCGCRRIAYVHPGKTGGSSIIKYMRTNPVLSALLLDDPKPDPAAYWYHVAAEDQRDFYGVDVWRNALKIGTVRNPFTWFVSAVNYVYQFKCKIDQRHRPAESVCHLLTGDVAADMEAMRWYYNSRPYAMDDFFPMSHRAHSIVGLRAWFYDSKTDVKLVDRIIHLEDEAEFGPISGQPTAAFRNEVCSPERIPWDVPEKTRDQCAAVLQKAFSGNATQLHLNAYSHADPFSYYTAELCAFVVNMSGIDFTQFGYNTSECAARVTVNGAVNSGSPATSHLYQMANLPKGRQKPHPWQTEYFKLDYQTMLQRGVDKVAAVLNRTDNCLSLAAAAHGATTNGNINHRAAMWLGMQISHTGSSRWACMLSAAFKFARLQRAPVLHGLIWGMVVSLPHVAAEKLFYREMLATCNSYGGETFPAARTWATSHYCEHALGHGAAFQAIHLEAKVPVEDLYRLEPSDIMPDAAVRIVLRAQSFCLHVPLRVQQNSCCDGLFHTAFELLHFPDPPCHHLSRSQECFFACMDRWAFFTGRLHGFNASAYTVQPPWLQLSLDAVRPCSPSDLGFWYLPISFANFGRGQLHSAELLLCPHVQLPMTPSALDRISVKDENVISWVNLREQYMYNVTLKEEIDALRSTKPPPSIYRVPHAFRLNPT